MRTVLIFAHECAPHHRPESTIGAQRPASFARHLPGHGWRAVVLCCDAGRRESATRGDLAGIAARALEKFRGAPPGESVVIPLPSLRSDGILDAWWRMASARASTGGRAWIPVRKALTVAKWWTGDYSQSWQPCARAAAEALLGETTVDACIGEHSPDAGLFLARWLHATRGVPWLADFRDPILLPFRGMARRVYGSRARRLLDSAAATVAVTEPWAESDRDLFARPSFAIPNGFEPGDFGSAVAERAPGPLEIAYTGSILPVQSMDLFLDGLGLVDPGKDAGIRFTYRGSSFREVIREAEARGIGDRVDAGARVSREEAMAAMEKADILLLLSADPAATRDPHFARGFYPGKTFEYFGARRPILCVPGDRGILDDLITRTRTGTVAATPGAVAEALRRWRDLRAAGESPSHDPDDGLLATFTRKSLAGRMASRLDEVAGQTSSGGRSVASGNRDLLAKASVGGR